MSGYPGLREEKGRISPADRSSRMANIGLVSTLRTSEPTDVRRVATSSNVRRLPTVPRGPQLQTGLRAETRKRNLAKSAENLLPIPVIKVTRSKSDETLHRCEKPAPDTS